MTIIKKATLVLDNPYVTDGLVTHFDGIWNAGLGQHDPAATEWADLITGNHTISTAPLSFVSDALTIQPSAISTDLNTQAATEALSGDAFTIEIIGHIDAFSKWTYRWLTDCQNTTTSIDLTTYMDLAGATSMFRTVKLGDLANLVSHGTCDVPCTAYGSIVVDYIQGRAYFYLNGTCITNRKCSTHPTPAALYTASVPNGPSGFYHALRIYNRRISETEMLTNYEIDCARFHFTANQ